MEKRGQISLEYMAVVGITTIVAISLLVLSNYYSKQIGDTIDTTQLDGIAKDIVDTAQSVYYFGEPSKSTLKVYLPKGITSVTVGPDQINFRIRTDSGETDVFYPSDVTLQGGIPTAYGFHYITIEAREGYVWINGT
jgi:uncharacterized protein (UPF0333 family)